MKFTDLNRAGGIGANALFIQLGSLNILVDCGLHPKQVGRAALPDLAKLEGVSLDLIIITHCHLDHIGGLPSVMLQHPNTPVFMSSASRIIIERMMHNSANVMMRQQEELNIPDYPLFTHDDVDRIAKRMIGVDVGRVKKLSNKLDEVEILFHHAGHVAGAIAIEMVHKHRRIFFSGDVLFENQRILPGAKFPAGHFDTVILETTRGATERAPGKERPLEINRLIETINHTINGGGSVLLPVFALGRMQELITVLNDAKKFGKLVDCPIVGSGLGVALCDYVDEVSRKTKMVDFRRSVLKEAGMRPLPRKLEPGKAPKGNAIYLVSSGMLVENTPSYILASGLLGNAKNTVTFVGYCDPDTPGGKLQESKHGDPFLFKAINVNTTIRAKVERFELSGHADREELLEFAVQATPRSLVLTHGDPDARAWFVEQMKIQAPETTTLDPVPGTQYLV